MFIILQSLYIIIFFVFYHLLMSIQFLNQGLFANYLAETQNYPLSL